MKKVGRIIFLVYCLSLVVMIKSRYLLVEIGKEPLASSVQLQSREPPPEAGKLFLQICEQMSSITLQLLKS